MNYRYFLDHGPDRSHLRETDMKVRMRLKREALPIAPLGRGTGAPIEARA